MTPTGGSGMTGRSVLTTPSLTGSIISENLKASFLSRFAQKTDAWCSGGGECTGMTRENLDVTKVCVTISCPGLNGLEMMCGRLDEETYELIIR